MPRHPRKKQRLSDSHRDQDQQPLGCVIPLPQNFEKDDEERQLESMLFGTELFNSEAVERDTLPGLDSFDKDRPETKELENLLDSDVSGFSRMYPGYP